MVVYYELFGQKVGSHILAIATLGTTAVGTWALSGGSKKPAEKSPPIQASSKDEENFIQEFLKNADKGPAEAKH
ncbi:hypothetical protein LTR86_008306 [Recurvomyces mirabilis]|nr:hypothetical protein LTR86_008306 [Recurvomyces mirabilis]